jgi:hypothetical protein
MRQRLIPALILGLAAPLAGPMACRSTPAQADPGQARETLQTALTAWQNGDAADSLGQRKPKITASDQKWREKYRLVRFEIADGSQAVGYDQRYRVVLWLQGPDGKETKEEAEYTVSTRPERVVIREES